MSVNQSNMLEGRLCVALYGKLIAELQSTTCRIGSNTCHPIQINMPCLNSS